ncbi:MAG: restriction endonuclease subunit S [Planctomycetaceae bacterium]|nr:restriction endonuclease subunit S [Planctomycetaceae bacterium]
MSVKKGYRQTEVGLIPDEWEVDFLERFWSVTDCKHITAKFTADGYPIVSIKEVQNRFVDLVNANRTSARFFNLLAEGTRRPRSGDLILSRNATVGEIAQVADWHPPFAMGQDVCLLRKRSPKYSSAFLQSLFKSPIISRQLSDLMVGSTFKRANVQQIKHLQVAMPNPAEQEAIAGALSDADAWIESLEQLLAKKRQIKQGAMQELLAGKRRLPGFSREWETKRLGELFEITSSKRVFQSDWKSEGIPFYRARELAVLGEWGRVDNELFIPRSLYDAFKAAHGIPEAGDMLVTGVGTLGKVYVVTGDHDFYFKDGNIIWFKIRGSISPEFLRQLYLTKVVLKQITDASAGTTVGTYTISGAKETEIPFPSLSEQTAIATILSDMDAEINSMESKLAKARQIKQGMMQELLTGRIRLV